MRLSYVFGSPSDWSVYDKGLQVLIDKGFEVFVYGGGDLVPLEELKLKLVKPEGKPFYLEGSGETNGLKRPLLFRKDDIDVDFRYLSAHRVPDELKKYFAGFKPDAGAFGAGLTNALVNLATEHVKVATGIPVGGLDSHLSTVQSPPGYPIAAVPLGKAEVAINILLKLCTKPDVFVDKVRTPKAVIDNLDKFGIKYTFLDEADISGQGVAILGYDTPKRLLRDEDLIKDQDVFIIGVNNIKYSTTQELGQWMNDFSSLNNTVIVRNGGYANAGLLAALMVGLHDETIWGKIEAKRAMDAENKYSHQKWTGGDN